MANVKIIFVCNSTVKNFTQKIIFLFFSIKHDKVSFIFQMFEKKNLLIKSIYQIATSNVVSQVAANLYYYFWMISVISKSTQENMIWINILLSTN